MWKPKAKGSIFDADHPKNGVRIPRLFTIYAGRVGTGFTHKVAAALFHQLDPMTITANPFAQRLPNKEVKGVRFVRPELVGEVEFRAWTAEGYVRHDTFRGMREDKLASEEVREKAVETREASK